MIKNFAFLAITDIFIMLMDLMMMVWHTSHGRYGWGVWFGALAAWVFGTMVWMIYDEKKLKEMRRLSELLDNAKVVPISEWKEESKSKEETRDDGGH